MDEFLTETEERPNYYAVIPAHVRYSNITSNAKLLYGDLFYLKEKNKNGILFIDEIIEVSRFNFSQIKRYLDELQNNNFINYKNIKYSDEEAFKLLNKKNSKRGCLFCGYDKYVLDQHHYPIRRKDSGTETITLCPNCHRAFHCLTSDKLNKIHIEFLED